MSKIYAAICSHEVQSAITQNKNNLRKTSGFATVEIR